MRAIKTCHSTLILFGLSREIHDVMRVFVMKRLSFLFSLFSPVPRIH